MSSRSRRRSSIISRWLLVRSSLIGDRQAFLNADIGGSATVTVRAVGFGGTLRGTAGTALVTGRTACTRSFCGGGDCCALTGARLARALGFVFSEFKESANWRTTRSASPTVIANFGWFIACSDSSTKFFACFEITGTGSPSFARSFERASRIPVEGSWPAQMQWTDGRVDPEELRPVREPWRVGSDSRGTTHRAG